MSIMDNSNNFPPEIYDGLSKSRLSCSALLELDQRNEANSLREPTALRTRRPRRSKYLATLRLGIARGGPDLSRLRGYYYAMVKSHKRPNPYDAEFKQLCVDSGIYPAMFRFPNGSNPSEPANFEEILQTTMAPMSSTSPTVVPAVDFKDFQSCLFTFAEGTLMINIVPHLVGNFNISSGAHVIFNNLTSLTSDTTVNPTPDFFDGTQPEEVHEKVRKRLNKIINPNQHMEVPIAPNFFLEVKGARGLQAVADGQVMLDGAHGASIMHALKNYNVETPVYDGKAHAFSSTLVYGMLRLYAHHVVAPDSHEGRPHYHTTKIGSFDLGIRHSYLQGLAAFANLRERARKDRELFIAIANWKVDDVGEKNENNTS